MSPPTGRHVGQPLLDLDRQNRYRRRYASEHPGWRTSGQIYEATVRAYIHPAARVLDLGCGRGGLIELLHGHVGLAAGLDPDRHSLVQHRQPAVQRVCGLAEHLPFPSGHFDLVVSSWVLEHVADPGQVFAEVARVLRPPERDRGSPGGHWVFLTPNASNPLIWVNRLLRLIGSGQAHLVRRLYGREEVDTFPALYRANTRRRLEQLAAGAGLSLLACYSIGDPTYLAFNGMLYRLAVLVERGTPKGMNVHMVGDFIHDPS